MCSQEMSTRVQFLVHPGCTDNYACSYTIKAMFSSTIGLSDPTIDAELSQAFNTTSPFRIEDFTYNNDRLLDVIFGHLENTSFRGVTVSQS